MELTPQLLDLLRAPSICYIATIMPDGSPQLTQTWVDTDGEHVLINTVEGFQKVRNIERDPRVALTITDANETHRYLQVRGNVINMTTEGGVEHIEKLAHKYTGKPYTWYNGRDSVRVILTIEARKISGTRS
jgi:PPOX class probable F420-dependent enzyme